MSGKFQKRALFSRYPQKMPWKFYGMGFALTLALFYCAIFIWPVVPSVPNLSTANSLAKAADKVTVGTTFQIRISPQSGLFSIAQQLAQQGVQAYPFAIMLSARAILVGSQLKPGTYLLPQKASLGKILLQIARGDRIRASVAIIPGMTIWQVRALLDTNPWLTHQTELMSAQELLQALNLNYDSVEGLFFPDTYVFDPEDTDLSIYRRAAQAMQKQLSNAWEQREAKTPLQSPYQLLTLASIIEKETGRSSDRTLISAVFSNRLNLKMPLQTDPTVIYGVGPHFDGNLRKSDLRKYNPYNTYMNKGLPPTPIAMPSKESLLAAVNPAKNDAIYFVARGDGSSQFSKNLRDHENAVDQFQRKRKTSSQTTSQH
ncbi:UPF0755 protein [Polynucleobacter brandtiae]|uniref:Endolytic murein transglycosylase n=3 Tax=Polynucleobacter brandtiae TaxID=1938816 RepID=A0A2M8VY61_9BURK|nr:UPF0755 protein [Polynucleobacter brandtiae]